VLGWLRRRPEEPREREPELFDETFQRRLEALALLSRRAVIGTRRGERRSKKTGGGIEFADHRDYAPGDDFRFVDWNAYGRSERLLVKLFQEEEDLSVHVLLDTSASMALPSRTGAATKLAHAKRLAAALAYVALAGLDRVSVSTFEGRVVERLAPERGRGRMLRVLSFLRPLKGGGATDLGAAMRSFVARGERRGVVIVISDFYDPSGVRDALDALRHARFDPVLLHVWDPVEARPSLDPELFGDLCLVDAERGNARDVTLTPELLARYEAAHRALRDAVARTAAEKHALHAGIETSEAWDEAVLRVLRLARVAG
jgi:uncharacterized protein (DUF58 family)